MIIDASLLWSQFNDFKKTKKTKKTTKNKNKNLVYLTKSTILDFQKVKMCNTTEIHRDQ